MLVIDDYKIGNLHSVKKKLDRLKVESVILSEYVDILNSTKLIFQGVGHFGNSMNNLHEMQLMDVLNEVVLMKKTPF
jgi:glutamine amidotransferase